MSYRTRDAGIPVIVGVVTENVRSGFRNRTVVFCTKIARRRFAVLLDGCEHVFEYARRLSKGDGVWCPRCRRDRPRTRLP